MRILCILILLLVIQTSVFATQYNVNTGYGYLTDSNGHIVAKAEYPVGKPVNITNGDTYTEVPDQASLDKIKVSIAEIPGIPTNK